MATITLVPNADVSLGGVALTGAATLWQALSDSSDASYGTVESGDNAEIGMGNITLPALAQIRSIQPKVRSNGLDPVDRYLVTLREGGVVNNSTIIHPGSIITDDSLAIRTLDRNGVAYTSAVVDSITFNIAHNTDTGGGNSTAYVYKFFLEVITNEVPVVVVTAPAEASSITTTTRPTVTWTYTDPESDVQERYRVKIFSAAQYGIGGFDPETSPHTWDSGEVFSAATTLNVPVDLANSTTFRAYVKAADAGSSGRYSLWDNNTFTINVTAPPAPNLVVTAQVTDPTGPRTRLQITRTADATPTTYMVIEYTDDAGATWATLRDASNIVNSPDGTTFTLYDYEAPPGTARGYRAKAVRTV